MKHLSTGYRLALATSTLLLLSACAGMTQQERSTAMGAGVGAIGGAVLTGGSTLGTLGTLGGAAVGGYIGHEANKR